MKTLFLLNFFSLFLFAYGNPIDLKKQDYCQEDVETGKFFILNHLIFFTQNPGYFENFRIYNFTSGLVTPVFDANGLLPVSMRNQEEKQQKLGENGPPKLLWMFMFDVNGDQCLNGKLPNNEQYCSRVNSMKGLIVGRFTNQELTFMRYSSEHLISVHDVNNFLEMQILFKHLDQYGNTGSVTFDQSIDLYVTTHYGRQSQICMTIIVSRDNVQISIPLIEQLLTVNQFKTVCYSSKVPYTSVIDISGSLYALNGASSVDQLKIEEKAQQFSVVQTNNAKLFFNCYGNTPIGSQHLSQVNLFPKIEKLFETKQSDSSDQILIANNEIDKDYGEIEDDGDDASLFWNLTKYIIIFTLIAAIVFFIVRINSREINGKNIWKMCRNQFNPDGPRDDDDDDDDDADHQPKNILRRIDNERAARNRLRRKRRRETDRNLNRKNVLNNTCSGRGKRKCEEIASTRIQIPMINVTGDGEEPKEDDWLQTAQKFTKQFFESCVTKAELGSRQIFAWLGFQLKSDISVCEEDHSLWLNISKQKNPKGICETNSASGTSILLDEFSKEKDVLYTDLSSTDTIFYPLNCSIKSLPNSLKGDFSLQGVSKSKSGSKINRKTSLSNYELRSQQKSIKATLRSNSLEALSSSGNKLSSKPYQSLSLRQDKLKAQEGKSLTASLSYQSMEDASIPLTSTSISFLSTREETFDKSTTAKPYSPPVDMVEHTRSVMLVKQLLNKYQRKQTSEEHGDSIKSIDLDPKMRLSCNDHCQSQNLEPNLTETFSGDEMFLRGE